MKANTSKPVTRIRQQITMPQPSILAREGFKFPPITPRAKKSPGWRLGSGFEGLILQLTDQRPETSHHQKIRHARTPCILGRSPPELELSTRLSSTRQSIGQRDVAKRQNDEGGSVETRSYEPAREYGTADGAVEDGRAAKAGAKGAFEQVACLTALLRPPTEDDRSRKASSSHRNGNVKEPIQVHQSQNRDLDSSQAIREPSQSERNGWLKRRKVDSAVAWEDEEEQLFAHTQGTFVNAGEHGRKNARNGLDTFLDNIAQAQRTFYNDVPVFNKGGQTASNPEQPVKNRRQDMVQHEQKAKQHRHPGLRDAEQQSWHSEKILDHQSSGCHPEPPPSSGSEAEISTLPSDAKDLPTPKARHHVEVLRTSEVPETQGRLQESLDFDHTATESPDRDRNPYQIPKTTLDSGNYFSNAVRQLDFPEKASHTITWRRSRREPDQDVRDSQVMFDRQEGAHHIHVGPITGGQRFSQEERSLDSGVTPGLKRRMSKVPFRPPFKEPL